MSLYSQAESNIRKTWGFLILFFIFVIFLGWIISYFYNEPLILWLAVFFSFFSVFFSYWHSDKIILRMNNARLVEEKDNPEIYNLVNNLCTVAGLPLPKIYIIEDEQPNAFATGRNPKHAVIAVTRGLLKKLDKLELEGVIAHELAHIGNRDMLLQTIVVVLVGTIIMMTDFFFFSSFGGRGRQGGHPIFLIIFLALMILAPIFAQLMKLAISRKREFLADASGALLTRYPDGLAKALEKISQHPSSLAKANDSTAHLFIVNPFRGNEGKSWLHRLFMTHPPVEERVRALTGMKI
ncbi:MAG: M48 family metallopeptidase [Candidatus Liptonbacteria bacterium]|nr:M48 family metallopeptidase [Candidatus Liptonbacteria bacterium]